MYDIRSSFHTWNFNKQIKDDNFKRKKGSEVGPEWGSYDSAMQEPFIIENLNGLGMKMLDREFSVNDVADVVVENTW